MASLRRFQIRKRCHRPHLGFGGQASLAAHGTSKDVTAADAEAGGKPALDELVDKASIAWPSDSVRVPTEVVGADGSYSKRLDLA